uniref:CCHC-type domain-containing protein n=1 Tax=Tanacetum cinerariifolium TaxID=118510 RepID=A0A6L2K3J6_TANCI|nr:hypothetical protein [Tanacetum cinerariifolium]
MSTQQDIYAAGSKNRPPMLNNDNYVPWSSRIIRYARSIPNGKMIVESIENGPYVRRMIATLGEPNLLVLVPKSFHKQTDEELTENDIKRMDADDQVIQTILLGLPEDVYATVDSCKTAKEIWELRQTKNLHEADFTQIYDFLKMNQDENSFNFPTTHKDQSSSSTHSQQSFPINNKYSPQPSLNQNFMQPPMTSLEDINDPTEAMNATLILFAKAFQLTFRQYARQVAQNQQGYNAWQNGGIQVAQNAVQNAGVQSGGNQNGLVVVPGIANQNGTGNVVATRAKGSGNRNQAMCYNCRGLGHIARNCTSRPRKRDVAYLQTQLLIAQNANCILMANLQHASTSGTQLDKDPVYDTYGSAKVNMVNCNMRATNAKLKSELARYKIQEQRIEISQEKYNKLEKCYQKSICQKQCLTRKINALHLSSAKQITTLNDEISNLNKQLSKEKSSISSLMEEKKKLKHDFKTREDKFLDKEVDLESKIKDLENILLKKNQTVQTMHMLNPKPDSFYHPNQKMALEEHDPHAMYDSEETLKLVQESHEKMRFLKKEIKPGNYAKINHMSGVFLPQTTKSKEELFLLNVSNMVTVSKTISIPNEDLSDDTTPSVARKFLNEVKSSLVTLQRVVKQKMTLEVHNLSSSAHKEVHRIIFHEIAPIINQVDARVQNFEIQFLQEASKFVRDFKSLAKEADESLDKQKSLELEIERLLKASVSHDITFIMQNGFVDVLSDLQTELDLTKKNLNFAL